MFYPSLDFIMGLSTPVKSHKPPKPPETRERRGKRMTGFAKRTVRSGIVLLEEMHGKRNLAFFTATIPDLPWYELQLVCAGWGDLARRLMQEIGRALERKGLNPEYVYVNELQEERWSRNASPAPHLHAVFQGRKTGDRTWAISKEEFRRMWERVLGSFLERDISLPAATRVEVIRKCPKRYMTKYMSKGGKVVDEIVQAGLRSFLPGSWWGMANSLRAKVKDETIPITADTAELIATHLEEYKQAGLINWFGRIWSVCKGNRWEVECVLNDQEAQIKGEYKMLLAVVGEFSSKSAMMSFAPS